MQSIKMSEKGLHVLSISKAGQKSFFSRVKLIFFTSIVLLASNTNSIAWLIFLLKKKKKLNLLPGRFYHFNSQSPFLWPGKNVKLFVGQVAWVLLGQRHSVLRDYSQLIEPMFSARPPVIRFCLSVEMVNLAGQ